MGKQINQRWAIVLSEFNEPVTERLLAGAQARVTELGLDESCVDLYRVPGAVEIPLTAQWLAKTDHYSVIIALGCVIRGETGHYDYVCEQVSQGCQQMSLQYNLPVVFAVLTTDTEAQALARSGGEHSDKGADAIDVAWRMQELQKSLDPKVLST